MDVLRRAPPRNRIMRSSAACCIAVLLSALLLAGFADAQDGKKKAKSPADALTFPPKLPNGKDAVTDVSDDFLKPPADKLREGVAIAKTPPKVDFLYYPCQTYKAKIWSNWGDGLAANGKY